MIRNETYEHSIRLTVKKIGPNHGAVGKPPVVYRFSLPNDTIPKGCQITNGRACTDILQVVPNGPILAPFPKLEEHVRILIRTGEKFVLVLLIELSGNGVVD